MSASTDLVLAAQKRLRDLDEERAELLVLLRRHGAASEDSEKSNARHAPAPKHRMKAARLTTKRKAAPARNSTGRPKRARTLAQQRGAKAFERLEGGPTEAVLAVLRGANGGGLTYSEVVQGALPNVKTN